MGIILNRRRVIGGGMADSPFIQFADPATKSLCVALWGGADGGTAALNTRVNNVKVTGVDGELTYEQAASIKAIANAQFRDNTTITSFDELQYFTGLTTIGSSVFQGSSLTSVVIPNSVTSIGNGAFMDCGSLTFATLPNGLTYINNYLFNGCYSLTSIEIPSGATGIGGNAFRDSGLTSVTIPNSVTSIGGNCFMVCTSLASVTIGNSVTNITSNAFFKCTNLASVTILAVTPPTLGSNAFSSNKAGRKIYVPSESVEAYKSAANWSTYAADIEAIPTT